MKELNVFISPMPPYTGISFSFSPKDFLKIPSNLLKRLSNRKINPLEISELIDWSLKIILADQFAEGEASGAWGRCYADFMSFLYNMDKERIRESITCSGMIAHALCSFRRALPQVAASQGLLMRLQSLKEYLKRSRDPDTGGFGLALPTTRIASSPIKFDLRHTIWAILTLWDLDFRDSDSIAMCQEASKCIRDGIAKLDPSHDVALTYATVQRLLAHKRGNEIFQLPDSNYRARQKDIEGILCEQYDEDQATWKMAKHCEKATIDNALGILSVIGVHEKIDPELSQIMQNSAKKLFKNFSLEVSADKSAMPFYPGGNPDLATTIHFLNIISSNDSVYNFDKKLMGKLFNFVLSPETRQDKEFTVHSYSWNVASTLHLIALYSGRK